MATLVVFASAVTFASCNLENRESGGLGILESDDTEEAIRLIQEANMKNLSNIRVLYKENGSKVEELKLAVKNQEVEKVRKLTAELLPTLNDGYIFANNAIEKIEKAQELNINEDWKEYLRLKQDALEMQVKAYDFRMKSAILFRDKFGGADKLQMKQAAETFRKNEESFAKWMAEAKKLNKQADQLAKDVEKK